MPNVVDLRKNNKGGDKIVIASAADGRGRAEESLKGYVKNKGFLRSLASKL